MKVMLQAQCNYKTLSHRQWYVCC